MLVTCAHPYAGHVYTPTQHMCTPLCSTCAHPYAENVYTPTQHMCTPLCSTYVHPYTTHVYTPMQHMCTAHVYTPMRDTCTPHMQDVRSQRPRQGPCAKGLAHLVRERDVSVTQVLPRKLVDPCSRTEAMPQENNY